MSSSEAYWQTAHPGVATVAPIAPPLPQVTSVLKRATFRLHSYSSFVFITSVVMAQATDQQELDILRGCVVTVLTDLHSSDIIETVWLPMSQPCHRLLDAMLVCGASRKPPSQGVQPLLADSLHHEHRQNITELECVFSRSNITLSMLVSLVAAALW